MLAGVEGQEHLGGVEVVRRGDVDDVDGRVGQQVVVALVDAVATLAAAALARARSGVEPTTPDDLDAEPPEVLDVGDADEPDPHHCRSQVAARHGSPFGEG